MSVPGSHHFAVVDFHGRIHSEYNAKTSVGVRTVYNVLVSCMWPSMTIVVGRIVRAGRVRESLTDESFKPPLDVLAIQQSRPKIDLAACRLIIVTRLTS